MVAEQQGAAPQEVPEGEAIRLGTRGTTRVTIRADKGDLHIRLYDESGHAPLPGVAYRATGPKNAAVGGQTDAQGVLCHRGLPFGDYELTVADEHQVIVPTLRPGGADPHLQVVPGMKAELARPGPAAEEPADEPAAHVRDLLASSDAPGRGGDHGPDEEYELP